MIRKLIYLLAQKYLTPSDIRRIQSEFDLKRNIDLQQIKVQAEKEMAHFLSEKGWKIIEGNNDSRTMSDKQNDSAKSLGVK